MKKVRIKSHVYLVAAIGTFFTLLYPGRSCFRQHWSAFLLAWAVATSAWITLWAKRLKYEIDLRPWRKQAATIDPAGIDKHTAEGQRQWLVWLYAREDYEEVAEYAAAVCDEVLVDLPCEALADRVRKSKPEAARRLYRLAMEYYKREGRQATGSGEGLMAMDGVTRLEKKMKEVKG